MRTPTLSLGFLLAFATVAAAQGSGSGQTEPTPAPTPAAGTPTPTAKAEEKFETRDHLEVGLRYFAGVLPLGTAFSPTSDDYSDLWDPGSAFGFTVRFVQNRYRPDTERVVGAYGLYLNIDRFTFPGGSSTDGLGNVLAPDDLAFTSIAFGAHLDLPSGAITAPVRFLGGVDVGLGIALIDSVDATLNGVPDELYAATSGFLFEATIRLGVAIRAGEQAEINVQAMLGYNFVTPPDNGTNAILNAPDAELMFNIYYGLQVSVAIIFPKSDAPGRP